MPITEELRTAAELEAAGAPHALAQVLARKLEESANAARQATLDVFAGEMRLLRADLSARFDANASEMKLFRAELKADVSELRAELKADVSELRAEFREELRKQMLWFFTVLTGLLGIAVAIIKLFPNAH